MGAAASLVMHLGKIHQAEMLYRISMSSALGNLGLLILAQTVGHIAFISHVGCMDPLLMERQLIARDSRLNQVCQCTDLFMAEVFVEDVFDLGIGQTDIDGVGDAIKRAIDDHSPCCKTGLGMLPLLFIHTCEVQMTFQRFHSIPHNSFSFSIYKDVMPDNRLWAMYLIVIHNYNI